ncbi:MAG: hypothetical protein ACTHMB_09570 [Candidatus Binatia bacterium]
MSKRQRSKKDSKLEKKAAAKRSPRLSPLFFLTAAIVVLVVFISWRLQSPSNSSVAHPVTEAKAVNPAGAASNSEFEKLKGRWRRPDGGYVMAINGVAETGTMDAAYFNPYPIHVGNAVASRDGKVTKVFVELRDVNYPGSTYTLTYEPSSDQLKGIYYLAVEQQRFEVVFERVSDRRK